jgi:hypothetical protein
VKGGGREGGWREGGRGEGWGFGQFRLRETDPGLQRLRLLSGPPTRAHHVCRDSGCPEKRGSKASMREWRRVTNAACFQSIDQRIIVAIQSRSAVECHWKRC